MTQPVGEFAARAIARVRAEVEGVSKKDRDRFVEDNWFGEWIKVSTSMMAWRQGNQVSPR